MPHNPSRPRITRSEIIGVLGTLPRSRSRVLGSPARVPRSLCPWGGGNQPALQEHHWGHGVGLGPERGRVLGPELGPIPGTGASSGPGTGASSVSVSISTGPSLCICPVCLYARPSVCLSLSVSVCLSVCLRDIHDNSPSSKEPPVTLVWWGSWQVLSDLPDHSDPRTQRSKITRKKPDPRS